jgi:hypothetical protein
VIRILYSCSVLTNTVYRFFIKQFFNELWDSHVGEDVDVGRLACKAFTFYRTISVVLDSLSPVNLPPIKVILMLVFRFVAPDISNNRQNWFFEDIWWFTRYTHQLYLTSIIWDTFNTWYLFVNVQVQRVLYLFQSLPLILRIKTKYISPSSSLKTGNIFLKNVGSHLQNYTTSQPRRSHLALSLPWETQISNSL